MMIFHEVVGANVPHCFFLAVVTLFDHAVGCCFVISFCWQDPLICPQLLWSGCAIVSTWASTSASVVTAMTQRSSQVVSSCAGTSPDTLSQTLHVIFWARFITSPCSMWMLSTLCCIKRFEAWILSEISVDNLAISTHYSTSANVTAGESKFI